VVSTNKREKTIMLGRNEGTKTSLGLALFKIINQLGAAEGLGLPRWWTSVSPFNQKFSFDHSKWLSPLCPSAFLRAATRYLPHNLGKSRNRLRKKIPLNEGFALLHKTLCPPSDDIA